MSVWLKWQSIGVYLPHELRQITLMTLKASQSHIVYLVLPDHICTMSPCKNFPILLSGRLPTCTTGSSLFFKNMFSEKKMTEVETILSILSHDPWLPSMISIGSCWDPSFWAQLGFFCFRLSMLRRLVQWLNVVVLAMAQPSFYDAGHPVPLDDMDGFDMEWLVKIEAECFNMFPHPRGSFRLKIEHEYGTLSLCF